MGSALPCTPLRHGVASQVPHLSGSGRSTPIRFGETMVSWRRPSKPVHLSSCGLSRLGRRLQLGVHRGAFRLLDVAGVSFYGLFLDRGLCLLPRSVSFLVLR